MVNHKTHNAELFLQPPSHLGRRLRGPAHTALVPSPFPRETNWPHQGFNRNLGSICMGWSSPQISTLFPPVSAQMLLLQRDLP